ncbi:MAG: hypothetical protein COW01_07915 [Bdellovibrionales bacterium CG12_big_fil_rev_8_21_14_0_65_38_15]|nr:MAG: hypothetical protein COW79_10875 [Bdellovibrionales bacterium CG22_combo_CG10-13_8_21_14_all_38_13]PIQ55296.1 MAG: hypothetical protein COW01_07915 [Bdellovibrionales bacterium CG12_big_fil_rev_8_21_14_0_65_38_15]PIR30800.1 MAG: hypothetical protein COV38_03720 [Bdellovibrionales bacterium CG11_big_fil_rev_8_21_14_0_20_38_13]
MQKYLSITFMSLFIFLGYAQASSFKSRALVVVIDLAEQASKHKILYRLETNRANKRIIKYLSKSYSKIIILDKKEATKNNFLNSLKELALDKNIETIDSIVYLHGKNDKYTTGPSICFVQDLLCTNIYSLAKQILAIPNLQHKLRALYSDACWGEQHLNGWLESGFKVAAGSRGVDSNHSTDLKRFMKKWSKGASFSEAIDHANNTFFTKISDRLISDADSTKEILGDDSIVIGN